MGNPSVPLDDAPTYRAYSIGLHGNIITAEIITAENDAQATAEARKLTTPYPIELWDRARFLGRFEPNSATRQG